MNDFDNPAFRPKDNGNNTHGFIDVSPLTPIGIDAMKGAASNALTFGTGKAFNTPSK